MSAADGQTDVGSGEHVAGMTEHVWDAVAVMGFEEVAQSYKGTLFRVRIYQPDRESIIGIGCCRGSGELLDFINMVVCNSAYDYLDVSIARYRPGGGDQDGNNG